ncbi:MAG: MerR family transcriptional regulator [Candidatus Omnitrophica bacterium]|nr:MerR family transcriptional regulator [Candidatus Omnitrophota bacterium]
MAGKKEYTIKEFATEVKVPKRNIMLWEKWGVLTPERRPNKVTGNNDRVFSEENVRQVAWVKKLQTEGYPMKAIAVIVQYYTDGKMSISKW